MSYQLFEEVVLLEDIPAKNLRRGDVATIVEYHPVAEGEAGYTLEVFNGEVRWRSSQWPSRPITPQRDSRVGTPHR